MNPQPHPGDAAHRHPTTAAEWDQRYSGERVWSGNPNQALLAEVAGMTPDTVLDVGCGEGADSVWLAQQGWQVTALDISGRAVEHTVTAARAAGVEVRGIAAPFLEAPVAGPFGLVSAMYPVLQRTEDERAERRLLELVAPGGTLLFVHHLPDPSSGFPVDDYVGTEVMARFVRRQPGWEVVTDEQRQRRVANGSGAGHHDDLVLRARRVG